MAIRKSDLNFIVDAVAFGCFLFMVATGVIMEYLLPPGSGQQVSIWGLDRHAWGDIHFWLAVVLLTTLALHVYLHWRWIVCVLRRRPSEGSGVRMSLGITALLALLAIALAPVFSPVERNTAAPDRAGPRWTMSEDVEEITGSMTLGEAAIQTGVAAGSLLTALALPADISRDERLGRLARDNGLSLADVREVLEQTRSASDADRNSAQPEGSRSTISSAERADASEHAAGSSPQAGGGAEIRGSMTLGDVVALTDVPLSHLIQRLGLPAGTPASERLGRLARQHGFTLVDVRDVVASYR
jgi:DNA-binding transcriptional MerR regulator